MSNLAKALVDATSEMPAVEKNAQANYGRYVTLDHLIAKTRPTLKKHGLAITQQPTVTEHGQPALETTLRHVSGEQIRAIMPLFLPKQDMQSLGSAITYARRYAWAALLGISSEEDDDGAAASKHPGAEPKAGRANGAPPPVSPAATHEPASAPDFPLPAEAQKRLDAQAGRVPPTDGGSPEAVVLSFGKHNGKTIGELYETQQGYLKWLAGESFDPKSPEQRRAKGAAQSILGQPLTVAVPDYPGEGRGDPDDDIPFMPTIMGGEV